MPKDENKAVRIIERIEDLETATPMMEQYLLVKKEYKDYILFYLKLLLESVYHEGELRFSDTIPYNENMLSVR